MVPLLPLAVGAGMTALAAPAATLDLPAMTPPPFQTSGLAQAGDQNPALAQRAGSGGDGGALPSQREPVRGAPRVSRTRCAVIGCGSACDSKGGREAQRSLPDRIAPRPSRSEAGMGNVACGGAEAQTAGYRAQGKG